MAVDESDEARVYLTAAVKLRGGGAQVGEKNNRKRQQTQARMTHQNTVTTYSTSIFVLAK